MEVNPEWKKLHSMTVATEFLIIFFEEDGQSKRPVVWFDELVINLPFDPEAGDTATAAP